MELLKLKKELKMAMRGHKMLKDKRDELMRQFLSLVRENHKLRRIVEQKLRMASRGISIASACLPRPIFYGALLVSGEDKYVEIDFTSIMGVNVPYFKIDEGEASLAFDKNKDINLPYSFSSTSEFLDRSVLAIGDAVNPMLKLASIEKTVQLLADEIEATRRRVNSLEHVKIPELTAQIRDISLKMEENERANLTRLMKVKDIIIKRNLLQKQEEKQGF